MNGHEKDQCVDVDSSVCYNPKDGAAMTTIGVQAPMIAGIPAVPTGTVTGDFVFLD